MLVLYDVAGQLALTEAAHRYREAVVAVDGVRLETARFYEDAMRNRGLRVRVLTDRAEAEAWLVQEERLPGA